ncbi:CPBP family intramembrane glutamic endopeptidase [Actibacterium sp. MT2.3-13A]|uniref:CPBP family intramembrane glutamic endopeptidase n=1 Tax=Actibacterium sp. MT2.3-13A TaxID=2828332 RepID=UPI001BA948B5|nr:CPBP family intramembrane glutamic endopeptidase [Actibacterium sp. MT2.3-13A]
MRYAPHDGLVAPARASRALWRVVLGYALISAAHLGLIYASLALAVLVMGEAAAVSAFDGIFRSTVTTRESLLLLYSFAFSIVGTVAVTHQLHRRAALGLIGPLPRALRDFALTVRALALLYAALWVALPGGDALLPNLEPRRWLGLLPLALPAILVQTSAEEMLFRGYLQQQLAARFAAPLVWMGLPALVFAWGHYAPGEAGANALGMALWAAAFSLCAADLTARTGSLGAAIGLHFANNALAILIVSLPGPVSGLSLYLYPHDIAAAALRPQLAVELAMLGVSWLAARVALRV